MSITSPPPPLLMGAPPEPIWRLSVAQYHQMIQAGILTEGDPVELLEGILVTKMVKNPPHTLATQLTRTALERCMPPGWFANTQEPVTTDTSEPEPDVTVVRGERRQYAQRHPGPADLGMLVEVADSSLRQDRTTKKRIYARASIPIYWIVNLVDRQIEVYTEPTGAAEQPDYRQRRDYGPTDSVPVVIDGREFGQIPVGELLP